MTSKARYASLGLVLLLGVGIRLALLLHWPRRLSLDEATVGLMGLHVGRGEFPIFYDGAHYMGGLESYLTAVVNTLLGSSPLTLRIAPFLFSCSLIVITFVIGRRMASWPGGLACALLVAVAPPFLPLYGNFPMLGYIEVLVAGSLLLLLTLDLATDEQGESGRARKLLVLGLVAGLGWWTNPLFNAYLATAGIFLVFRPAVWSVRGLWAVPLFFLLGSLPYWIFNLTHAFGSLAHFRRGVQGDFVANLQKVGPILKEIVGVRGFQLRGVFTDPVPFLSPAAGLVYLGLLGILLVDLGRSVRLPEPEARRRRRGIQLLLLFSLVHLTASSFHDYARFLTTRYLFPLYSSIPILTGIALLRLWRWSRPLAVGALVVLLLNNGVGLWSTAQGFEALRQKDWWKPEPVVALLQAEGLTRAYANGWISLRLTFETQERIVVADPFLRRDDPHLQSVDASPRIAYILSERYAPTPTWLESSLQGIGARYQRENFGEFAVFYDFRPPFDGTLVSLPPNGWRAEAAPSGSDPTGAFDRRVETAWLSEESIKPGMWYRLDLGRIVPVGGITILPVRPKIGIPQGYRIELSQDGTAWDTVASAPQFDLTLRWRDGQPRMERSGHMVSRFEPRPVRYIRITQTGEKPGEWWAIAEVFVYGPSPAPVAEHPEAATHLRDGLRLEKTQQWAPALAAYERAARLDPDWDEAHSRILDVYHRAGLPLEGSDLYRRGLVFEQLGLWEKAARQYETLVERTPEDGDHSDALTRLLEIYRRQGERDLAERVERRLRDEYSPPTRAEIRFGRSAGLLGYGLEPREARAGEEVELVYYWQTLRRMTEDFTVFVHLVRDGRVRFVHDHEPLHGRYATSSWREGELVRERYRVRLPPELPPGEYELRIGLWNPKTGRRLSADTSLPQSGSRVRLTTLRVLPSR